MSVGTYPPADTSLTIPLAISNGGTGATTAANARTNLGLGTMATQNANAVAITDGSIALGGAGTGLAQLAVASTFYSSDAAAWIPLRIYPKVETASQTIRAIRIEPVGGAQATAVTSAIGVQVIDPGTLAANATVYGISTAITAGTNRYNIYAQGTAPNYFAGNVGIGVGPTNARLQISYAAGAGAIQTQPSMAGLVYAMYFLNNAGTNIGSIATNDTTTAFNTTSDVRLKHAIAPLSGALERIQKLKPISHLWNIDDSYGEGFLAHELQQIIPLAITGEPDALNEDGTIRPQQTDYSKLVPWIIAGMQELLAQVRAHA